MPGAVGSMEDILGADPGLRDEEVLYVANTFRDSKEAVCLICIFNMLR